MEGIPPPKLCEQMHWDLLYFDEKLSMCNICDFRDWCIESLATNREEIKKNDPRRAVRCRWGHYKTKENWVLAKPVDPENPIRVCRICRRNSQIKYRQRKAEKQKKVDE